MSKSSMYGSAARPGSAAPASTAGKVCRAIEVGHAIGFLAAHLHATGVQFHGQIDLFELRHHGLLECRHTLEIGGANAERLERRHPPFAG